MGTLSHEARERSMTRGTLTGLSSSTVSKRSTPHGASDLVGHSLPFDDKGLVNDGITVPIYAVNKLGFRFRE